MYTTSRYIRQINIKEIDIRSSYLCFVRFSYSYFVNIQKHATKSTKNLGRRTQNKEAVRNIRPSLGPQQHEIRDQTNYGKSQKRQFRLENSENVLLPCIPTIPSDTPIQFKRLQFPIRLTFSISINRCKVKHLLV